MQSQQSTRHPPARKPSRSGLWWTVWWIAFALLVVALLPGCAGLRMVDPSVTSHTQWTDSAPPVQAGDTFAFDRLPSQLASSEALPQTELEALTTQALAPLGLQPAEANAAPRWLVQVQARMQRIVAYNQPGGWFPQHHVMISSGGGFVWSPVFIYQAPSYSTESQLTLLMRPAPQGPVVFESRAVYDGPAPDRAVLWKALLDAALRDFPNPPTGPRRIVIDLPQPDKK